MIQNTNSGAASTPLMDQPSTTGGQEQSMQDSPSMQFNNMDELYAPNPVVRDILWMRIDHLDPSVALPVLDSMVTPQNVGMWLKLFPELEPIIMQSSAMQRQVSMSQEDMLGRQPGSGLMPATTPMQQPMGAGLAGQRFEG